MINWDKEFSTLFYNTHSLKLKYFKTSLRKIFNVTKGQRIPGPILRCKITDFRTVSRSARPCREALLRCPGKSEVRGQRSGARGQRPLSSRQHRETPPSAGVFLFSQ